MLVTLGYTETVQSYESRQALMAKASQSSPSQDSANQRVQHWKLERTEQNEVNETEEMNLGGRKKETDKIKENEWKDGKNAQYSENYRKWYNQH